MSLAAAPDTKVTAADSKPVVFIHSNPAQSIAATVAAYALTARSRRPDAFAVRVLRLEETPHLHRREGQRYVSHGEQRTWHNRDAQSHSPLRMMVPQLMGFRGRALVLDPDIFAVGDVNELLQRELGGRAILCKARRTEPGGARTRYASSVMLLDCQRLTHWRWDQQIDEVFACRLDLFAWMTLQTESPDTIGTLEDEWNHFDTLDARTKLLHNTERLTQPWKTGLAIDFDLNRSRVDPAVRPALLVRLRRKTARLLRPFRPRIYQRHPDPRQERYFFQLLRECLDRRVIDEAVVREEIHRGHLRPDAFTLLDTLAASSAVMDEIALVSPRPSIDDATCHS
jgi:hypothetical protein